MAQDAEPVDFCPELPESGRAWRLAPAPGWPAAGAVGGRTERSGEIRWLVPIAAAAWEWAHHGWPLRAMAGARRGRDSHRARRRVAVRRVRRSQFRPVMRRFLVQPMGIRASR